MELVEADYKPKLKKCNATKERLEKELLNNSDDE